MTTGLSLEQAQAQLDAYLAADTAVLNNQSYSIAGRTLTRANLADIQHGIALWNQRVQDLSRAASGRGRCRHPSPL